MKDTFHIWANVGHYDLDVISDLIVTGRKAKEALPDKWLLKYLGDPECRLKVMDFGCGMGRNTFEFGIIYPHWTIVGYDNEIMLTKTNDYYSVHYTDPSPKNVSFVSDWDKLKTQKFDTIFCCIVLQHIHEAALAQYIIDFKKMASRLVVAGRRFNDDVNHRSTWAILEDSGLIPDQFYHGDIPTTYNPNGHPEDHHLAIYNL